MRFLSAATFSAFALYAATARAQPSAVFRFPEPPARFKPAEASVADLAKYGLPARPNRLSRDTTSYDTWARAMSAARKFVVPEVRLTGRRRGTVRVAHSMSRRAGAAESYNWAGEVITSNVGSYGPGSFSQVIGQWVLSTATQAIGTCNPVDVSATWVGLDGYLNANDVVQAGTESDAYCDGGNVSPDYYAWFEWAPDYEYELTNFSAYSGMPVFVVVQAYSSTSATATFVNLQTNEYTTIGFGPPAGTRMVGSSAEWIVERPQLGNAAVTASNLADYGMIWMSSEVAYPYNSSGIYYTPGSPGSGNGSTTITMVDGNGNPLAEVFPQGPSAFDANVTGSAY